MMEPAFIVVYKDLKIIWELKDFNWSEKKQNLSKNMKEWNGTNLTFDEHCYKHEYPSEKFHYYQSLLQIHYHFYLYNLLMKLTSLSNKFGHLRQ